MNGMIYEKYQNIIAIMTINQRIQDVTRSIKDL